VTAQAGSPRDSGHEADRPGVYLGAMAGLWYGPSIRPVDLDLGADWSISNLRWSSWSQRRAYGHGSYVESPDAGRPITKFEAAVTVMHVQVHYGDRYFAIMKITGIHGQVIYGKHQRVLWLDMNTHWGFWQDQARPGRG
jgi:hypothetical protein